MNDALKRGFDIAVATVALILLGPLFLVIAATVRLGMGKPVLFRQMRAGFRKRPFMLFKFRTMKNAPRSAVDVSYDAARLTPLGRVLRAFSIDEIPQLWNVLKGDMSLVGPRPLLVEYLDRYTEEQTRRHEVRPGITGWAQVNGRNSLTWEDKFKLDVWYVDHRRMWLDFQILARTVGNIIRREGISQSGQATMPEFLGTSVTNQQTCCAIAKERQ